MRKLMSLAVLAILILGVVPAAKATEFGGSYAIALSNTSYGVMNGAAHMNWPDPRLSSVKTFEARFASSNRSHWVFGLMFEDLRFSSVQAGATESWLRTGHERTYGATVTYLFLRTSRIQPFIGVGSGFISLGRRYQRTDSASGQVLDDYRKKPLYGIWSRALVGADVYLVRNRLYLRPAFEHNGSLRYRLGGGVVF